MTKDQIEMSIGQLADLRMVMHAEMTENYIQFCQAQNRYLQARARWVSADLEYQHAVHEEKLKKQANPAA